MTIHPFPGSAPAIRACQDPKTQQWIKDIASTMTGDVAPEDLTMAEPGTPAKTRLLTPDELDKIMPVRDYAPSRPEPDVGKVFNGPVILIWIVVVGLALYGAERLGGDAVWLAMQFINN